MEKVLLTEHMVGDVVPGRGRQERHHHRGGDYSENRDQCFAGNEANTCDASDGDHCAPRRFARPDKSIRCGLACASSPIAITPPRRPPVIGAKVMRISQLDPGVSCVGQALRNVKSPIALRRPIVIGTGPLFVRVTLRVRCLPTLVAPNLIVAGSMLRTPGESSAMSRPGGGNGGT